MAVGGVAATAIAQQQQLRRGGITLATELFPPQGETLALEFAGVVAGPNASGYDATYVTRALRVLVGSSSGPVWLSGALW